jgi:hypothetical protein
MLDAQGLQLDEAAKGKAGAGRFRMGTRRRTVAVELRVASLGSSDCPAPIEGRLSPQAAPNVEELPHRRALKSKAP